MPFLLDILLFLIGVMFYKGIIKKELFKGSEGNKRFGLLIIISSILIFFIFIVLYFFIIPSVTRNIMP